MRFKHALLIKCITTSYKLEKMEGANEELHSIGILFGAIFCYSGFYG